MEQRISKLEASVEEIKAVLGRIEGTLTEIKESLSRVDDRLRKVEIDTARTDGRLAGLDGQIRLIPNVWQTITIMVALMGGLFAVLKLFGPSH